MTKDEALKMARTALGVQLDALLGKAGHLRNDDRRRYAENGIKAIDEALAQPEPWEKFCDSNCVWTDHHPDCKLAEQEPAGHGGRPMTLRECMEAEEPEQEPVTVIRLGQCANQDCDGGPLQQGCWAHDCSWSLLRLERHLESMLSVFQLILCQMDVRM